MTPADAARSIRAIATDMANRPASTPVPASTVRRWGVRLREAMDVLTHKDLRL